MSLKPQIRPEVPEETTRVAKASFPKGNKYMHLRKAIGNLFDDADFADLYPKCGQPGIPPWQLALITVLQFGENLSDRSAANAVRARIDWKYLLCLDLTNPGFHYSILTEFRSRLISSGAEERLFSKILEHAKNLGVLSNKSKQRTDATHVLACIRNMNRLELVGETLRSALNEIANLESSWLQTIAPVEWYDRYARRIENNRLPKSDERKEALSITIGQDGFFLLGELDGKNAPKGLSSNLRVNALRTAWSRHYVREDETGEVKLRPNKDVRKSRDKIESPYDTDASFRTKRGLSWTGYMVHFTETCSNDSVVNIITNVHTTPADVHDIKSIPTIHDNLIKKNLVPGLHLVDSAYVSAEVLLNSKKKHNIDIIGPLHGGHSWRNQSTGAYTKNMFAINWGHKTVVCPEGKESTYWKDPPRHSSIGSYIEAAFGTTDCKNCKAKPLCIKGKMKRRTIRFLPQDLYEAQDSIRRKMKTNSGQLLYNLRAGVEGTLSQGVRAYGLRKSRYKGMPKTHLQELSIAAAMNLDRISAWLSGTPLERTRQSSFYRLRSLAA